MALKIKLFDRKNLVTLGTYHVQKLPDIGDFIIVSFNDEDRRYQVAVINQDWRTTFADYILYVVPKKLLKEQTP